jgi:hypothetical protein
MAHRKKNTQSVWMRHFSLKVVLSIKRDRGRWAVELKTVVQEVTEKVSSIDVLLPCPQLPLSINKRLKETVIFFYYDFYFATLEISFMFILVRVCSFI